MKSTLMLLLLFCVSYTAFARIDTVYTEQNGVVTMQILETPDDSRVLEEKSFKNTTPYTFTDQEVYTLMSGGTAQKGPTRRMETLFPPRFVEEYDVISLENGATQQDTQTSEPKMSWLYLVVCVMLPFVLIQWLSVAVPSSKRNQLIIWLYVFLVVLSPAITAFACTVFTGASAFAVAGAVIVSVALFAFAFVVRDVIVSSVALSVFAFVASAFAFVGALGNTSLAIQYTAFIAVSCLVGYGTRQLWLRRKEKKLVQVQA